MPHTHRAGRDTIESLLAAAADVLADSYGAYDTVAARDRLTGDIYEDTGAAYPAGPRPDAPAPTAYPSAHDEAAHELDLACALVVNAAAAADSLARLVDDHRIDPEGALVFACLLHITGRAEAADFWWRFGAGGGSRTAAYCLYLSHRRYGEFRDAAYWRTQAAHDPDEELPAPVAFDAGRLLPDAARHALLVQWHSGLAPTLPAALERVIDRLDVAGDDEDFGEIPCPSPTLVDDLRQ
ncbi:hypothetical protein ACFYWU_08595 [Streptomyces chrestomyceticus]|uniref:hypothetical protein n=1 Tax=Streptomyces chrestomyceticus TaxID=68185 RepID=UPI0019D2A32B|nr:hypothetical protein [Streptomyces chrestomyceticus]